MALDTSKHLDVLKSIKMGAIVYTYEMHVMYCGEYTLLVHHLLQTSPLMSASLMLLTVVSTTYPLPPPLSPFPSLPPSPPIVGATPNPDKISEARGVADAPDKMAHKRTHQGIDLGSIDFEDKDLFDIVCSDLKRYKCRKCGDMYATTDAVRKHARKRHEKWITGLRPSEYAVDVYDFSTALS